MEGGKEEEEGARRRWVRCCRAVPPLHPGCWRGDARVWVLTRVPRGLVPNSAPELGPGDETVTLRQVCFLLGGYTVGTAPVAGGTGTLIVWSWLMKCGFRVRWGRL